MGYVYGGSDFMFTLVPIFIMVVFIVVFGLIIASFIKGAKEWNNNNKSPVLIVPVKVVTKRTSVSTHHHHNPDDMATAHTSNSTTYYITFEVESCDRIELLVPSAEFGMIVEGDSGKLTFQGTRFKGFERNR